MTRSSVFVNFEFLTAVRLRGTVEVKLVGAIAVFYWADHAVKEVKIVDLHPADAK